MTTEADEIRRWVRACRVLAETGAAVQIDKIRVEDENSALKAILERLHSGISRATDNGQVAGFAYAAQQEYRALVSFKEPTQ